MTELIVYNGELYHAEDFSDEFLAHYGVPGMKWGKRTATNTRDHVSAYNTRRKNMRSAKTADAKNAVEKQYVNDRYDIRGRGKKGRAAVRNEKKRNKALLDSRNHRLSNAQRVGLSLVGGSESVKDANRNLNKTPGISRKKAVSKGVATGLTRRVAVIAAVSVATGPSGAKAVANGAKFAGKHAGKAARAASTASKMYRNHNGGQYINEAGRRVWANPNFKKSSYNAAKQVSRAAREITR